MSKIEEKLEEVEHKGRKTLQSKTRRRNILIGVVVIAVLTAVAFYIYNGAPDFQRVIP